MIRSRIGSAVLIANGAFDAVAGSVLLAYYLVSGWGANALLDRVLQLLLLIAIVCGATFVRIGLRTFRERSTTRG